MKQKLVSLFFSDFGLQSPTEHLNEFLTAGWIVKQMTPVGSGTGGADTDSSCKKHHVKGWVLVLLEKS